MQGGRSAPSIRRRLSYRTPTLNPLGRLSRWRGTSPAARHSRNRQIENPMPKQKQKGPVSKPEQKKYIPSDADHKTVGEYFERRRSVDSAVTIAVSQDDAGRISGIRIEPNVGEYEDDSGAATVACARLALSTGIAGDQAARYLLGQIFGIERGGNDADFMRRTTEAALEIMAEMKPRDPAEGLLLAQMIATHNSIMTMHAKIRTNTSVELFQSDSGLWVTMERTYASQLEALARYRSQGKQKVPVVHKYVDQRDQSVEVAAENAQVNFPNPATGGGGKQEKASQ